MEFYVEQASGEAKISCLCEVKLSMQVLKKNEKSSSEIPKGIRGVTEIIQRQKT